jgi:hypothetical protein
VSRTRARAWLVLALVGNAAAWGLFAWRGRPAAAQLTPTPPKPQVQIPVSPDPFASPATSPQPIQVTALDGTHFVVVTREPRLTTRIGQDGPWQNMLVTVVSYYTVLGAPQGGRLVSVEHVRVPAGYRALEP